MSDANSILEAKLTKCSQDNAQKDALIDALLRDLRNKMQLIEDSAESGDLEEALQKLRDAGQTFGEQILEREYGRIRSPLEADAKVFQIFGKGSGLRVNMDTPITPSYTFKVRFKNFRSAADNFAFTRTSPPMPMVCGPVAIYLIDQDTVRILLGAGKTAATYDFFDDGGWIDICAKVTPEGGVVFVDGRQVLSDSSFTNKDIGHVTVGCGHLERHWSGQIASAAVVQGDWEVESNELPEEGVLFRYDGNKITVP